MKLMLTCAEAGRLIAESQDRPLGLMERISLRFHLLMCKLCLTYERQLLALRKLMTSWAPRLAESSVGSPAHLPDEVRARIRESMRQAR